MRRLVLQFLALALVVVATCVGVLAAMPQPTNGYFTVVNRKWAAASTRQPKILLVGGSNVAFGIDSRRLHETFGRPVVNMGLNAGLGLRYMLEEASQFVHPGDVIVVSPEYEHFYGNLVDGREQLVQLAWIHPASLREMRSPGQIAAIVRAYPNVFQQRLEDVWLDWRSPHRAHGNAVYNENAFDEFGDVVSHLGVPAPRPVSQMGLLKDSTAELSAASFRLLENFRRDAEAKGARVYLLPPTIPQYHWARRQPEIRRVFQAIETRTGLTVLAPPDSSIASDDRFFDTAYHLNREGRAARTEQLVRWLEEAGAVRPTTSSSGTGT